MVTRRIARGSVRIFDDQKMYCWDVTASIADAIDIFLSKNSSFARRYVVIAVRSAIRMFRWMGVVSLGPVIVNRAASVSGYMGGLKFSWLPKLNVYVLFW